MIRIAVMTDDLTQAGSFWRSGGWLSQMVREYDDIQWTWFSPERVASGQIPWSELRCYSWIVLHRPCLSQHVGMLMRAQDLGIKVMVDYDDWLHHVPIDNRTHTTYVNPEIRKNMDIIIKHADVVTTSTRQLRDLLTPIRGQADIVLCPNALPLDWFERWRKKYSKPRDPNVVNIAWRGSEHHQADLLTMRDAIVNVSHKFENIKWKFIGFLPWFLIEQVHNVFDKQLHIPDGFDWENRPPNEVTIYFKNVMDVSPDIVIVPLANTMFNKAKSNIGWIEGMWAGARTIVAPDWEEWRQPGVMNYIPNDPGSFEHMLTEAIIKQKENRYDDDGWAKIKHVYDLSKINVIRKMILTQPNVKGALQKVAQMETEWYKESTPKKLPVHSKKEMAEMATL